jgi:Mrp family chromosome partitioning ATPase
LGRSYLALADRISRQWWMQASAALLLVAPDMEPEVCRTAAHLAARLARHGTRDVLLMDCNVTDKSLSDLFELRGKAGLTDVLHGRADAAECVTPTSIDGLFVLPAGRGDARQFDDVTRSVGNLLAQLKQRYRYVIASGDAQEAAGRVIARLCDGTYVLVRLGQTEMEPAALTMQHLLEAGARVLGCVVVNAPEGLGVE